MIINDWWTCRTCSSGDQIILIMSTCSTGDPSFWSCQHVLQVINHSDHVNMFYRWSSMILSPVELVDIIRMILIMSTCSTGSSIILIMSEYVLQMINHSDHVEHVLQMINHSDHVEHVATCDQSFWSCQHVLQVINHSDHVNMFYRFINHSDHVNMLLIRWSCRTSFWSCQHVLTGDQIILIRWSEWFWSINFWSCQHSDL